MAKEPPPLSLPPSLSVCVCVCVCEGEGPNQRSNETKVEPGTYYKTITDSLPI